MKSIKWMFVTLVAFALLVGAAVPSFAQEGNVSKLCRSFNDFGITHGGCVSTFNNDEVLTPAAYAAQCQYIKATDPEAFYWDTSVNPQEYGFGGTIGACKVVLRAYHTGQYGP